MPDPRRAFATLVRMHLRALRGQFVPLLLFTLVLPLVFAGSLYALFRSQSAFSVSGVDEQTQGAFIMAVATVAVLLGIAWVVLPQHLARMRAEQQFGFFAGFAVGRVTYLLAVLVTYAIAALPGVLIVPAVVAIALHMPLSVSPALVAVVLMSFAALAATGGALGLVRLSTAAISASSTALYIIALGVLGLATGSEAPALRLLSPATLAANLLAVLLPHPDTSALALTSNAVALAVAGLILYAALGGYLMYRLLPWRVGATQPQTGQ